MKKIFYATIAFTCLNLFCNLNANAQGGVAINTAGTQPDSSAVLDVSSLTKGQLMPRMNTEQRNLIIKPATGLFIFNTDCGVINYNAGTPSSPNWATVAASNVLTAGVSITASPAGAICTGTSVTFSATPSQNNLLPSYQWQVNGSNVGTNSATYTNGNLNNGDVVTCILSSNVNCVTGSPATSNAITVLVSTAPSITGTTPTSFCSGSSVSLSASASSGIINWYNVSTGGSSLSSGTSFTISGLSETTTYYVDATDNGCTSSSRTAVVATYYPSSPAQPGTITGPITGSRDSSATYSINQIFNTSNYIWSVSLGIITSGQGSTSITVAWGDSAGVGSVSVAASNPCGTSAAQTLSVNVGTQNFNYTSSAQTFTVPINVTSINIQCWGAQGSTGGSGLGGYATGNLVVTPGEQLGVYVGGQNGFNGGGIGNSGNGGGGTDVRQGGAGLNNRVIVAGGGGAGYAGYAGGAGGGTAGGAASYSTNGNYPQGGTQNAGGNWGGTFGTGANSDQSYGGSGGGGGWYGGGSNPTTQGAPVINSSGGGGSGYIGGVTGGSMQTGVHTGDGQIVITW